MAEFTIYS